MVRPHTRILESIRDRSFFFSFVAALRRLCLWRIIFVTPGVSCVLVLLAQLHEANAKLASHFDQDSMPVGMQMVEKILSASRVSVRSDQRCSTW